MKRYLLGALIGTLTFTLGVSIYNVSPQYVGRIEAYFDLLRGKHIIKVYGRFAEEKNRYNAIFNEYGVELMVVGGCSVTEDVREEIRHYNGISMAAIEEKFGNSIEERLSQEYGRPNPAVESEKTREFAKRCELQKEMKLVK